MTRERGFTLMELLVTIAAIGAAGMALAASANGLHRENATSRAYCSDVSGLRRTIRLLRDDLQNAPSIEKLEWRREGDRLYRGRREVARNVREFAVTADGRWATARIGIGRRSDLSVGDGAMFTVRVRMRNAGRAK